MVDAGTGDDGDDSDGSSGDVVGELERLAELRERDAVDDEEYERAEDVVLGAREERR